MKERKSNFEALRIVAMIMIVAAHYSLHGVMQMTEPGALEIWNTGSFMKKAFVEFFTPGSEIGVALFFILAGYFGISRKTSNVLRVALETAFYGIVTAILYLALLFIGMAKIHSDNIVYELFDQMFIPISSGIYWFVTVYIIITLTSPLLNQFINKLNRNGQIVTLITIFVFEYSLSEFGGGNYYLIQRGLMFYFLGAVLRNNISDVNDKRQVAVLALFFSWLGATVTNYIVHSYSLMSNKSMTYKLLSRVCLATYADIFVPIAAISMFIIFAKTNVNNNKLVNGIARTTFGIYLIHDSAGLRAFIWDDLFNVAYMQYENGRFVLYALVTIVTIFVVCSMIDFFRVSYIEPVTLRVVENMIKKVKDYCEIDTV